MNHIEIIKVLKSCTTSDVADALLILSIEGCLMPNLHAVQTNAKFAGRAFTSKFEYVKDPGANKWYYEDALNPERLYCTGYDTIDECPTGDVLVSGGADDQCIGGLLAYRAAANKGVEAYVFDGRTRDFDEIAQYKTPQFCTGRTLVMAPMNLKEVKIDTPVVCDGVHIRTGDYILGDGDGVVAIPQKHIEVVIEMVKKIMVIEAAAMKALDEGLPPLEIEKISASRAKLVRESKMKK